MPPAPRCCHSKKNHVNANIMSRHIAALVLLAATAANAKAINDTLITVLPRPPLTHEKASEIKEALREIIAYDHMAQVVRLAFHDCVDGCDGCLNPDDADNGGRMLATFSLLNDVYDERGYANVMSRGDYYALAGIVGVEQGLENNNKNCTKEVCMPEPVFHFMYGREDCDTSPLTSVKNAFPSGHLNHTQVMDFFSTQFGLNHLEAVALMGAHALGKSSGASGFIGHWSGNENASKRFNNHYYAMMSDQRVNWTQVERSALTGHKDQRWQWEGNKNATMSPFMLNADMALFKNILPDETGHSTCSFDTCERAPTSHIVELYAMSPEFWLQHFIPAFEKMITTTNSSLHSPLKMPK